jgi:hypothetical protein
MTLLKHIAELLEALAAVALIAWLKEPSKGPHCLQ